MGTTRRYTINFIGGKKRGGSRALYMGLLVDFTPVGTGLNLFLFARSFRGRCILTRLMELCLPGSAAGRYVRYW